MKSPNSVPAAISRKLLLILKIGLEFGAKYYHIESKSNPADSRGCDSKEYVESKVQINNLESIKNFMKEPIQKKIVCSLEVEQTGNNLRNYFDR